ncbi:MAG: Tfp pilus assembly protein PilX [Verrucomicrobiales bacterium]|jgi:Tfp pilus assembly protein PilX
MQLFICPMKQQPDRDALVFTRRDENGVAIITVMSVLMLMTIMVVSFFVMATDELRASRSMWI